MPQDKFKETKPMPRDYAVAQGYYVDGKSAYRAVLDAGYSQSYAKCFGSRVAKSLRVKTALLEIHKGTNAGQLADMAEARLERELIRPPKEPKARLGVIRTALELGGRLGGPSELHLHQHNSLPPSVQKMLMDKMREIEAKEVILDGSSISERPESPAEG